MEPQKIPETLFLVSFFSNPYSLKLYQILFIIIPASKRLIGRSYNDPAVQDDIRDWPFSVVEDENKTKIRVDYRRSTQLIHPEEVAAAILVKMKKVAEQKLRTVVRDVVISIPAYFNDAQRQATNDAAKIAELNVLHLIHEPTAAAMAYGLEQKGNGPKTILVYDLGGGTFDVSVLEIDGNNYTVRAVNGDTHLGGEDFDKNVVNYFVKYFRNKFGRDVSDDPMVMAELRKQCEKCKRLLSTQTLVKLTVPCTNLSGELSRAKFNHLNEDLFERTIELLDELIKDARLQKADIDEVVLVGGSSRIPKIQEMVSEFFNGKELNKSVNPDEVVALGAAIRAGKSFNLKDVCPLSLSTRTLDGSCAVVIPRNTQIPAKETEMFRNSRDHESSARLSIYEGERKMADDNHFLGEFILNDLPLKPRGEVKIQVTFEMDINGILTVTAVEPTTGVTNNIVISNKSRLTKKEAARLVASAAEHTETDKEHEARLAACHKLENSVYKKLDCVKKYSTWDKNRKKKAKDELQSYLDWIESHKKVGKNMFGQKLQELEILFRRL